jgi:sugar/nucleoside kinase (ribokinase family)
MKYDFLTIGGATEDVTFYTHDGVLVDNKQNILQQKLLAFEYGAKVSVDKFFHTFGGGAANAAVCLSLLGLKTACLVSLGDDERGKKIVSNFKKKDVKPYIVTAGKNIETGMTLLVIGPDNEHVAFTHRGANTQLKIGAKEEALIKSAKNIYLTSLSGKWQTILDKIFKISQAKIYWNPGYNQLHVGQKAIGKYLTKTEVLIVNKDEALELVMSCNKYAEDSSGLDDIKKLLLIIKNWGSRTVIITNGEKGADAYDGSEFFHHDAKQSAKCADTTGVGDAFGSTFSAGMEMFKGDIKKAMHIAIINSASVVTLQGAQNGLLNKAQLMKIAKAND